MARLGDSEIGVEVTACYYNDDAAKSLWTKMQGRDSAGAGYIADVRGSLIKRIEAAVRAKRKHDYGNRWLLLVHVDARLTTVNEFENDVLPSLVFPNSPAPLESIFARLDKTWWSIYPHVWRLEPRSARS